jgi:hypothetical protein
VKRFSPARAYVTLSVAAAFVATALVMPAIASAQSAPPETIITQAPPNPSGTKDATISFTGTDDTTPPVGLQFQCRLDPQNAPPGTEPVDCLSPQVFTGLAVGQHTFEVQARDQDGLTDATPASYTWTVLPPQTCAEATATASADADASVDEQSPIENFGADPTLKVMSMAIRENSRAVVRFPLPPAPAGCVVQSATLRLYSDSPPEASRILHALRLASAWGESNITWDNQPATAGPAAETWAGFGYVQWDVTAQVQAMYADGGNHGFLIRHAIENDPFGAEAGFFSKEQLESPPQLVVCFAGCPSGGGGPPAPPPPPLVISPPAPPPLQLPTAPVPGVQPPAAPATKGGTPGATPRSSTTQPLGPSVAQLVAALKDDLRTAARTLRRLGIAALVRKQGTNVKSVHALIPGTIRISTVIGGRRVVVLRGTRSFARAGKATLRLKLTKKGRQVLKRKRSAKFTLRGSFTNLAAVVRASGPKVTVKRKGRR